MSSLYFEMIFSVYGGLPVHSSVLNVLSHVLALEYLLLLVTMLVDYSFIELYANAFSASCVMNLGLTDLGPLVNPCCSSGGPVYASCSSSSSMMTLSLFKNVSFLNY